MSDAYWFLLTLNATALLFPTFAAVMTWLDEHHHRRRHKR